MVNLVDDGKELRQLPRYSWGQTRSHARVDHRVSHNIVPTSTLYPKRVFGAGRSGPNR